MTFAFDDIVKSANRYKREAQASLQSGKEKANWVWEALQGDFNPNRSTGQIGLDTAVCLVPGLDTIMDIRDLIANVITIARTPASGMAWFSLVLTLIGFIPELGSVAKGVVKIVFIRMRPLIKHVDDLTNTSKMVTHLDEAFDAALPEIIQFLRHPKVQKFLTMKRVPDVVRWVGATIRKVADKIDTVQLKKRFNERANDVKDILNTLKHFLPDSAGHKIKAVFDGIVTVQKRFDESVDKFIEPMRAVMRRLAERLDNMYWVAYTQQVNKGWIAPLSEAGAKRLIKKHQPPWVKVADPVTFKQLSPERFKKTADYKKGIEDGAPELGDYEIKSFAKGVKARKLSDGETLYRIVDPTSGSLSTCWITQKVWDEINRTPEKARELWRGRLAVKPHWNQNGTYIKFTYNKARDGEITVWEGPTAMQFLNESSKKVEDGFLEGGLDQVVWHPIGLNGGRDQLRNAKSDGFVSAQFPDMVEGNVIKDAKGNASQSGVRIQINDPRIEGPIETGWGFKDFEDQHDIIGLPNPLKE
ncbi:hypothetical protein [Uliginosibacterium sp. TH139]|uniref:hypothetical protein n=1 Tax=Uliginosibacterium sp. TH139 TaxID=2067453 RepID=UPI000C7DC775|nr:hypothetical protein [Uliginosibacterium sp. TH139]PLK47298.1 hypothetical protein C0V76_17905 [Uliginosibacterium sp. TH139]